RAFKIRLLEPTDNTSLTLTAAGDYNGDGYDDLLVGVSSASTNGDGQPDGSVTMVYGGNYDGTAQFSDATGTASAASQSFVGNAGDNTLDANSQAGISFRGGDGNDTMIISDTAAIRNFDGGAGTDTLKLFFSNGEATG